MKSGDRSRKYDIFLLDADDTLFDFSACSRNALQAAMRACGIPYGEGDHQKYTECNEKLWRAIERREIEHGEIFEKRFSEFLLYKGENPARWAELNGAYVAALQEECVPFEGAEKFLETLKGLGRIYIITNGTAAVQRRRFEKFGMNRFSEKVFISEEIGAYKPAAAFLDRVKGEIPGFASERAVVIGDSLTSDMALAANCGLDCIWCNFAGRAAPGNKIFMREARNYGEIIKMLKRG